MESCIRCGTVATKVQAPDGNLGTIYIRAKKDDKWGNHPICLVCWDKENPSRKPAIVLDDPDEEKQMEMAKITIESIQNGKDAFKLVLQFLDGEKFEQEFDTFEQARMEAERIAKTAVESGFQAGHYKTKQ